MPRSIRLRADQDPLPVLDRAMAALMLAYLCELEHRQEHVAAGYSSMELYCIHVFGMDEEGARQNVRAARTVGQFPRILHAVADGRLTVLTIVRLAPFLTPETGFDLLAAAAGKTDSELEQLLARRFPRSNPEATAEPR